ncbi:MAG: hypothetical protein U9Q84_00900 [Thermodesulfobacteriota bacterium]|nr:hypothetical protein [Thermodesulfobacteriota bacterium]
MAFRDPATIDEIKSHSYVLTPGCYVGAEERGAGRREGCSPKDEPPIWRW